MPPSMNSIAQHQRIIVDRKQQFLQSKKHFLSCDFQPSTKLTQIAKDGKVPLNQLKAALAKVNRDLKRHSRSVYSRQMLEHVVEQIDQYYWTTGTHGLDGEGTSDSATEAVDDEHTVYTSDDLTLDANIAKLTPRWDSSADPAPEEDDDEIDQDDYQDALVRLQGLSARRLTLQQKLNTYRTLLTLLEPYKNAKENVQPNMVWKESPLAPELAKTRTLAIRVSGRVEEKFGGHLVPDDPVEREDEHRDVAMDDGGRKKLERLLSTW